MITCSECGNPISESASFCPECGNPIEYSLNMTGQTNCPNCGAPMTNFVSCEYCGTVFPRPQQPVQVVEQKNDGLETGIAAFLGGVVGGFLSS